MFQLINDGMTFLSAQSWESLFRLYWFVLIFHVPRYTLAYISVAVAYVRTSRMRRKNFDVGRVSVVIVGHNEEDSFDRCVAALHEQSRPPDEIIAVSDGSTDRMPEKLWAAQRCGLIQEAHCLQVRGGKAAAGNLALSRTTGNIVVNVDCDCTFDRHALRNILAPFADPRVGAVSGYLEVRNADVNLITVWQAIEYTIGCSCFKRVGNMADQMTIVSGAFGAFRRAALEQAAGYDPGGGEDMDLTFRVRSAGWKALFAPDAVCYTDVPATFMAFTRQRFRWERDAMRLRTRRHRDLLNPFSPRFKVADLLHQLDFLFFGICVSILFPCYLVWMFITFGEVAPMLLIILQVTAWGFDLLYFLLAASMAPSPNALRFILYLPWFLVFQTFVVRFLRFAAWVQEWVFKASYQDPFAPRKVHLERW